MIQANLYSSDLSGGGIQGGFNMTHHFLAQVLAVYWKNVSTVELGEDTW